MDNLIRNSTKLIESMGFDKKRYLYNQIDFSEQMIGIIGQRGVGKTTIMLQYLKEQQRQANSNIIYLSMDDVYFLEHTLKETVENLYHDNNYTIFCIDEVHKYKRWNQELKNIYDFLPDVQVIFSGSSSLDIIKGAYDLSRRVVIYELYGFSFREFLEFKTGDAFDVISINDIFTNFKRLSVDIFHKTKVKKLFKEYLEYGYYPFYLTSGDKSYKTKLKNALDKTIYEDITNLYNLKTENIYLFKRILNFVASSNPGSININKIASGLDTPHQTIETYIDILCKVSLLRISGERVYGQKSLRHSEKTFLNNTNLLIYLAEKLSVRDVIGSVRELFLLNQTQNAGVKIHAAKKKGDFVISADNTDYTIEIGGKSKDYKQIAKIPNSFLVLDDIEIGIDHKIPLYLFGFLY